PAPPKLGQATADELVNYLEHPNGWYRDTASRLLFQRQPHAEAVARKLEDMARHGKTPQTRVHAMHALAPLAGTRDTLLQELLRDPHPRVREHALRLCESAKPDQKRDLSSFDVWRLRSDEDPNVRVQLAHSLRFINVATTDPERTSNGEASVFVLLALKDVAD